MKKIQQKAAKRRQRILKMLAGGMSRVQIGKKLGISRQRVQQLLKRAAVSVAQG